MNGLSSNSISGYELSRAWFDFSFTNPELINPNHSALYFFAIEHCNRLGWKDKFGLPTTMAMEAIGIKSYKTYKKTLTDLIEWGFIVMVQKSTNQYSSNIIALVKNTKAHAKAMDKAMAKQRQYIKTIEQDTLLSNDKSLDVETPPEKFTKKVFLDVLESEFGDKVNPEYYKIAKSFQLLFIRNAKDLMKSDKEPAISKSKFKTVYDPIRLMIETDGASLDDVRRVYKFLAYTKNDFWKKNCQSTDKLRKQFDRLSMEASKHEGTN